MNLQKKCFLLLCVVFLLSACRFDIGKKKQESSEIAVSVLRFDKMLNDYVEFNSFSALQKMSIECPAEMKLLIEDILGLGEVSDNSINGKLKDYFSDPTLQTLMKDALLKFNDMSEIEERLSDGFGKLKKEVPSLRVPLVYSQISALNESVVVSDSLLGISIDKYMGEDYPLYRRYYYGYQRRSMQPDRIVPDCFVFYLMSEYPFPMEGDRTLLDLMMHYGKIQYVVAEILGYKSVEEVLGYTEEETKWSKDNRKAVWEYMLQNGHLYATDPMIIRKYNKPAPYTAFFGDTSPALIGVWMGTQLVDSYMKNHRKFKIKDLLEYTDYRQMLAEAKFKP